MMIVRRIATAAALVFSLALPAMAQPATTTTAPRPTTTAPAPTTAAPTMAAPAAKPVAKTVNVNTATAKELDSLPSVGAARSKSILAERAKGSFKDWPDFDKRMTGTNVNAGVKKKIKDLVTF